MSITKTTARAEIYDIAKAAGFDVECAEGVERKTYGRFGGDIKVEYVTRFLLRRSAEAQARLAAAGARVDDDEFTVLFKDVADSFADAWQRSKYSYLNAERPWTSNNHTLSRVTKTQLIDKLEKKSVDRLVPIAEARKAQDEVRAREAHEAAIQAAWDAHDAQEAVLDAAAAKLAEKAVLVATPISLASAKALIKILLIDGTLGEVVATETRIQTADRNRDAKANDYLRITGQS